MAGGKFALVRELKICRLGSIAFLPLSIHGVPALKSGSDTPFLHDIEVLRLERKMGKDDCVAVQIEGVEE